jgi:hypothetical protein
MRRESTASRHKNPDPEPLAGSSPLTGRCAGTTDLPDLAWKKSSASTTNGNCVEVAYFPAGGIAVRDSKDKAGAILRFGHDSWRQFLDEVRQGSFPAR